MAISNELIEQIMTKYPYEEMSILIRVALIVSSLEKSSMDDINCFTNSEIEIEHIFYLAKKLYMQRIGVKQ